MDKITSRKIGALYGLAIGDALGAAVEFKTRHLFAPVTGYRDGGPHGLAPGEWTDDTSMALALSHSISKGWDLDDQIRQYIQWWKYGAHSVNGQCFDIGNTVETALMNYSRTGDVTTCARRDNGGSGNGSIMRLAPIAIFFHTLDNLDIASRAAASSSTTHNSPQCLSACRYLSVVLAQLINGRDRFEILRDQQLIRELNLCDEIGSFVNDSLTNPDLRVVGSGWVVKSLQASLWAFYTSDNFEQAVLKAVNLGDDADTTGAITGQLAGACWGFEGISASLIEGLAKKDLIDEALSLLSV